MRVINEKIRLCKLKYLDSFLVLCVFFLQLPSFQCVVSFLCSLCSFILNFRHCGQFRFVDWSILDTRF